MCHPNSFKSYVFFPYRSNISNTKPSFGWGRVFKLLSQCESDWSYLKAPSQSSSLADEILMASGRGPELCDTCSCLQLTPHQHTSTVSLLLCSPKYERRETKEGKLPSSEGSITLKCKHNIWTMEYSPWATCKIRTCLHINIAQLLKQTVEKHINVSFRKHIKKIQFLAADRQNNHL